MFGAHRPRRAARVVAEGAAGTGRAPPPPAMSDASASRSDVQQQSRPTRRQPSMCVHRRASTPREPRLVHLDERRCGQWRRCTRVHWHAGLPSRHAGSAHDRRLPGRWCDVRARGRCLQMHSMGRARRSVIDAGRRIASSKRISLWLRLQRQLAALARRLAPIRRSRSLRWLSYVRVVHRSYTVRIDAVVQRRRSRNSRADRTSGCGAIFERQDLAPVTSSPTRFATATARRSSAPTAACVRPTVRHASTPPFLDTRRYQLYRTRDNCHYMYVKRG